MKLSLKDLAIWFKSTPKWTKIVAGIFLLGLLGSNSHPIEKNEKARELTPTVSITETVVATPTDRPKDLHTILKVVDGDTIQVDIDGKNQVIRLIGVDTPESVDPRRPVQCFANEATKKSKEILLDKKVSLESDATQDDKDKYGRLLRYVFLEDGTNFNKMMISQGYAHEYTYKVPYKYMDEFKEAEKIARESKQGLWADDACPTSTIPSPTQSYTPTVTKSVQNSNSGGYVCGTKTKCGEMSSCAEAMYFLNTCGVSRLDGDKDGTPCETLCN